MSRPPVWQRLLLPGSVALNLFLVSVIGAHLAHIHLRAERLDGSFSQAVARAEAGLSAQDAARFDVVMRRDTPRYEAAAAQLAAARHELRAQIRAERFDPKATRAALAAWQAAWLRFMDAVGDPLVEGLGQVSPQGRRKLAAATRAVRP